MYFGLKGREVKDGDEVVYDIEVYLKSEVRRIVKVVFEAVRKRRKKVIFVDKLNILEFLRFWREIVEEVVKDYFDVVLNYMYVDNVLMQFVKDLLQFDVIFIFNMFGDILFDEVLMIVGLIGMFVFVLFGEGRVGFYELIYGIVLDIVG